MKRIEHRIGHIDDAYMPTPEELFELLGVPEDQRFAATKNNFGKRIKIVARKPKAAPLDDSLPRVVK